MKHLEVNSAILDECPTCGAYWVDFFDGEFSNIAREVQLDDLPTPALAETCSCPDCGVPLQRTRYLDHGPAILRCIECMGSFLTWEDIHSLSSFFETEEGEPPSWWTRFWDWAHSR